MTPKPLLNDVYASPQITSEDLVHLAEAGFSTVICNRPDSEVPPALSAARLEEAAREAGLTFVVNPIANLTLETVEAQRSAIEAAPGPTLAYCASGTRSALAWAFAMAGTLPTDDIVAALETAGYAMPGIADQIKALAAR